MTSLRIRFTSAFGTLSAMLLGVTPHVVAAEFRFAEGVDGYAGCVDTYITEAPGTEGYAYGDTEGLIMKIQSKEKPDDTVAQVLVRFDDIIGRGAGRIPPGSQIDSAVLRLTRRPGNIGGWSARNGTAEMLQPFTDESTWESFGGDGIQPGTDEARPFEAADLKISSTDRVAEFDVTESVRAWVAHERENHGWHVGTGPNTRTGFNYLMFASSETAIPEERPTLIVETSGKPIDEPQ